MKLRQATLEDLEGIYKIEICCFTSPWAKESIEKDLTSPITTYIVAEVDDQIVGYAGFWKVLDEGQITNVAVHPSYRGLKIGKRLLEELLEVAKENHIERVILEVRKSNEIAQKLYTSLGFVCIGERKNYYQKPTENALLLEKVLA